MKTKLEVIEANEEKIIAEMESCYRSVLECDGRVEYKIYVWEDGEIEIFEDVQGGTTYLKANEYEERWLYGVTRVSFPNFDPFESYPETIPEDEDERDALREELIDEQMSYYSSESIPLIWEEILTEASWEDEREKEDN